MADRILTLLGTETAVSTASTVGGAQLVRVYNNNASAVVITVANTTPTTIGTCTVATLETVFIRKKAAETIAAATSCKMVSVAFGD